MNVALRTDTQRAETNAKKFADSLVFNPGSGSRRELMTVVQSQAFFTKTVDRLGILNDHHQFFEFDPNSPGHNVRAIIFNLKEGPDQLEMMLQSINEGADRLWVSAVLSASSTDFVTPSDTTVALVDALVNSAPSLSESTALLDLDYRDLAGAGAKAPDASTQTLLVFVTVAAVGGEEGGAAVRVVRIRGTNLLCGNSNCQFSSVPALSARHVCSLCHGGYCCDASCNLAASAAHHIGVCSAIRAWHRGELFKRKLPAVPHYFVAPAAAPDPALAEPEPDVGAMVAGGGAVGRDAAAEAAAGAEEEEGPAKLRRRVLPSESPGDETADEFVEDTQPAEDVDLFFSGSSSNDDETEVVPETPPTTLAATATVAKELFPPLA